MSTEGNTALDIGTRAKEWMSDAANRSRQALEDAMAVVKEHGTKVSDYFSEQVARGTAVAEDVSTCQFCIRGVNWLPARPRIAAHLHRVRRSSDASVRS